MITEFKIFERRIYTYTKIENLSPANQILYKNLKFEVGEPVRLKDKGIDELIFYIDWIDIQSDDNVWYHIKDDDYIYGGIYYESELAKLSDEEKMALKYNL